MILGDEGDRLRHRIAVESRRILGDQLVLVPAQHVELVRVRHFVLGRYLAHFTGGAEPDRRAAWGTWPQVLRLAGARPFAPDDRNPLETLFSLLTRDTPADAAPALVAPYALHLGTGRIQVFTSFATYRAAGEVERTF